MKRNIVQCPTETPVVRLVPSNHQTTAALIVLWADNPSSWRGDGGGGSDDNTQDDAGNNNNNDNTPSSGSTVRVGWWSVDADEGLADDEPSPVLHPRDLGTCLIVLDQHDTPAFRVA